MKENSIRPGLQAALLAASYVILCSLYIVVSGAAAAALSGTVEELEHRELLKGVAFVFVTGALFFAVTFILLKRIRISIQEMMRGRDALVSAERRAQAALFAAAVAHDFNNILAVIGAAAHKLAPLADAHKSAVAAILEGVDRGGELARRLSSAGKEQTAGPAQNVDLHKVVKEALTLLRTHPLVGSCTVELLTPEEIYAQVHAQLIHQIIYNLVLNAAVALDGRGTILIRLSKEGEESWIEVHDSGPGLSTEAREHLFEPFFTTKGASGTGLGLLSVQFCARVHGGAVEADSSHLGGACFRVKLRIPPSGTPPLAVLR